MTAPGVGTATATQRGLIDTSKILGKPSVFAGEPAAWRDWRFAFETWWACLDASAEAMLDFAVNFGTVIDPATSTADVQELGRVLYLVLAQTLRGRPLDLLKSVAKSNGFEAYRILVAEYEPKTKNTTLGMLQSIMGPTFGATMIQFMTDLVKWENEIRDYNTLSGKTFDEDLMVALVMERAPSEIKLHVQVNAANINNYNTLRELIRNYFQAAEKFKGPSDMDVGAIKGKDKGKGKETGKYGKPGGKFGKEYGKGGKFGKPGKDGRGGKKGKDKDVSMKDKSPATSAFQGECRQCGKWGHKAADCGRKQVNAVQDPPASTVGTGSGTSTASGAASQAGVERTLGVLHHGGLGCSGD